MVTDKTKTCPYCGEEILTEAVKCKHCGEWLNQEKKQDVPVITSGFFKYCDEIVRKPMWDYSGKAGRKEFWLGFLYIYLIQILCSLSIPLLKTNVTFAGVILIGMAIYYSLGGLSLTVRRLHDIEKSGWWILIGLIPFIGQIWLLILMCQPGLTQSPRVKFAKGDWILLLIFIFVLMFIIAVLGE